MRTPPIIDIVDLDNEDGYVWKTKDGQLLRMSEITDQHLENIVKLLWKTFDSASGHSFQGEEASAMADQYADEIYGVARFFQDELEKRQKPS